MALRHLALLAGLLAGLLVVVGCTADEGPGPQPTDEGTPLASYAIEGVNVVRADFCGGINPAAVERALAEPATITDHYGDGDTLEVSPGVTDIAHEFNCTFVAANDTTARAWVFAPPVTRDEATTLVRQATQQSGCTPIPGAPPFGIPSVATRCSVDGLTTVSFRGLFNDAWLSCSISDPGSDTTSLQERTDRWCAAVVEAASRA